MFNSAAAVADARLLAAAGCYPNSREMFHSANTSGSNHSNNNNLSPRANLHHHSMLHQHPSFGGLSAKDIEDLKKATKAMKSLKDNSYSKLTRESDEENFDDEDLDERKSGDHCSAISSSENNGDSKSLLSHSIRGSIMNMIKPKKRGAGTNSNNFSIESLIGKDCESSKKRKVVTASSNSNVTEISDNEETTIGLDDDDDQMNEGGLSDSILSDSSEDEGIVPATGNHRSSKDTKSNVSCSSSTHSRSQTPEKESTPVPKVSSESNHSMKNSSSPNNNNNNNVHKFMPNAGLIPAYPFYAAAFLSAQSLLYNPHYFSQYGGNEALRNRESNNNVSGVSKLLGNQSLGSLSGNSSHHYGSHHLNGNNATSMAAAMLFNGKDLSRM